MKNNKWQVTQNVASHLIVVFSGILFYLGLSNFAQVKAVAGQVFSLLSPFFIGIAIAYLTGILDKVTLKKKKKNRMF